MAIRIEGLEECMNWLKQEVVDDMNKTADVIEHESVETSPVGKTGRFVRSWRKKKAESITDTAEVENTVPYAAYVEAKHSTLANAILKAQGDQ